MNEYFRKLSINTGLSIQTIRKRYIDGLFESDWLNHKKLTKKPKK